MYQWLRLVTCFFLSILNKSAAYFLDDLLRKMTNAILDAPLVKIKLMTLIMECTRQKNCYQLRYCYWLLNESLPLLLQLHANKALNFKFSNY